MAKKDNNSFEQKIFKVADKLRKKLLYKFDRKEIYVTINAFAQVKNLKIK